MNNLIIKIAKLPEDFPAIAAIRKSVFQEEQKVDPALEFDGKDEISNHLIAYLDQQAVGTARIRYLDDNTAKIERLAVLSVARRQGIGKKMTELALEIIANQNIPEVVVHAQVYIKNLYKQLDFIETGETFTEADILHIKMRKKLNIYK
ncbi:GNAT family N-acetyltransferase [Halotia branconii]|uniref:GNAT family N-acetyltransferase n=1 Tax=Halotia branconii CENA392 TaxID=1539056 RepID=A0AAJ6NNB3_9CYAN|nr:GNAT family N-acetyltransferase [Halotia branconii]WGV23674.1 GNAT family N-acetyltransferase [Halotia branconii CENA392]